MTRPWDDAILSAYVDGELDPETTRAVDDWVASDIQAARRLADMVRANALVRAAMGRPVDEPLPPGLQELLQPVPAAASNVVRPWQWGAVRPWMALAASLALVLSGVFGGRLWTEREVMQQQIALQQDRALASVTLANALERQLSGDELAWQGTAGTGTVVPLRTWQEADGRYCREYRSESVEAGERSIRMGVSCRQPSGGWINRFELIPASDFQLEPAQ